MKRKAIILISLPFYFIFMKIQGIYKIRNCLNGKVYIGQSTNIKSRFKNHKAASSSSIHHPLYNAIRCYGIQNFEFIILEEVQNILLLDVKEQYWMDYYKSYDRLFGYNIESGARGCRRSEETKQKIGNSNKNKIRSIEFKKYLSSINLGKTLGEDTKRKISSALKGKKKKPFSSEHRKNISLAKRKDYSKFIKLVKEFGIKQCGKCGKVKKITEFNKDKTQKDTFSRWCKECRSLFDTSWKYKNICIDCGKYTQGKRCASCAYNVRVQK